MPDNRSSDGVKAPLCQGRKFPFQFAIVSNQGGAKFGDLHPASVLASLACYRHALAEGLLQTLDQEPGTTIAHANVARALGQGTGIPDRFEKRDLPRPNAGLS